MHALIVGAGLAGPCLALSLAKHGIRSTLFELRPARGDAGGSISLGPHGLRVLDKYAGVYDRIKASGYSYRRFGAYSEEGESFGEIYVGEKGNDEDQCYPAVRIMRPALHKVLIEAVEDRKELIDITWGMILTRLEQDDNSVTAYFEDGTQAVGEQPNTFAGHQRY
jgi:2-polyprenyl-6-methoxyphenol hydroxylase-like FAD-dependent oxidoreductase